MSSNLPTLADGELVASVDRSWARLCEWLSRCAPEYRGALPAGVAEAEITTLESALQVRLPADLRRFLELTNGTAGMCIFQPAWAPHSGDGAYQIYGAAQIASAWQSLRALFGRPAGSGSQAAVSDDVPATAVAHYFSQDPIGDPAGLTHEADGVRALDWNLLWLPIGDPDYSRQRLCIDLDPAPAGCVGQVILVGTADSLRLRIASSFAEFLEQAVSAMEDGRVVATERQEEDGEEGAPYFYGIFSREAAEREQLLIRTCSE